MAAVLDASALLALIHDEPGASAVAARLADARVSAVNLAEVASRLSDIGLSKQEIEGIVADLGVEIVSFDRQQALLSAELRGATRARGLSLGDRACLALARRLGLAAVTADREWAKLSTAVEVELIR